VRIVAQGLFIPRNQSVKRSHSEEALEMRSMVREALVLLSCILLFAIASPVFSATITVNSARVVALTNVRIVDAIHEHPIENGILVFSGNMITACGEVATIRVPSDAQIMDLSGKTIMPGLIDVHCHVTFEELASFRNTVDQPESYIALLAAKNLQTILQTGVTTIRDCGGLGGITESLKRARARNLIPGPRFFHAGRAITNSGGHGCEFCEIADGTQEIIKAIRRRFSESGNECDFIKVMWNLPNGYTEEEIRAAIETTHKYGKRIAIHAYQPETIEVCVRLGADTIEHGHQIPASSIPLAINKKIVIAATMLFSGKPFTDKAFNFILDGRPLDEPSRESELAKRKAWWKMTVDGLRPYAKAGGLLALGTDCGSYPVLFSDAVNELILHQELGLNNFQIVQVGTINGAKAIGIDEKAGTLEKGKWADILVLNGNPLEDLKALKNVEIVILDGKVVYKKAD
jgi:imidazolonepropionase-like amidohydrolase